MSYLLVLLALDYYQQIAIFPFSYLLLYPEFM